MCLYGYVRVSSKDQNEDRQLLAMKDLDIPQKNIYIDKVSGKDFNRPGYRRLLKVLQPGDLVYVKSIDRLGRDYNEILNEWRKLVNDIGIDIVVLDMPLLDTRNGRDLLGTFLSDIVLQVLSFVAENERENIKGRQAEGIQAARLRGVKFGRPRVLLPDSFYSAVEKWKNGEMTCSAAARSCQMPFSTFRRKALELEEEHAKDSDERQK